jgi:undecaprenyl-diphosphatase
MLGLRLTDLSFEIGVHVATAAGICLFLREELVAILSSIIPGRTRSGASSIGGPPGGDTHNERASEGTAAGTKRRGRALLLALVIGTVPAALAGLVAYDQIERVFHSVRLTVMMLPVTGLFLMSTRWAKDKELGVSPLLALLIGAAQAVAIIPGLSRSGLTIGAAVLLGVKKEEAVKFSFLLSLPAILGGAVLKLVKAGTQAGAAAPSVGFPSVGSLSGVPPATLAVGLAVSFFFAVIGAKTLLRVVRKGKLEYFGYYCVLAGVAGLVYIWH